MHSPPSVRLFPRYLRNRQTKTVKTESGDQRPSLEKHKLDHDHHKSPSIYVRVGRTIPQIWDKSKHLTNTSCITALHTKRINTATLCTEHSSVRTVVAHTRISKHARPLQTATVFHFYTFAGCITSAERHLQNIPHHLNHSEAHCNATCSKCYL